MYSYTTPILRSSFASISTKFIQKKNKKNWTDLHYISSLALCLQPSAEVLASLLKLMLWPTFQMFGRAKNKVAQEENINKQKEEEGTFLILREVY